MITLEALVPEHFEQVAGWLARPETNRWLTSEWRDRPVTKTLIAMVVRNKRNLVFVVRHEGQPAGLVALADLDVTDRTAMVWYVLGEKALSGRGITSEAVRQLARLAFQDLGLASIYAWAMADNEVSQHVLRKTGFREAGRLRSTANSNGQQVDRVYFDLVPPVPA